MDKGAHFRKCDFQVHSPRDRNWEGTRPATEDERKTSAESLIANCRERGLGAIAITDHHDVVFFEYARDAAANETDGNGDQIAAEQRIVVFPGIEVTLALPCQVIVLFDAELPVEFLGQALTALGVAPAAASEPRHAETQPLEHIRNIDDLAEKLNEQEALAGRFIILPNVTPSGHKTILREGFAPHYKSMHCVGGYTDGALPGEGRKVGEKRILNGGDRNWGNKALGLFQTSDSRSEDRATLGKCPTWVKWAVPTAEALRQACLARESRISQVKPVLPRVRIASLNVGNSTFMGPVFLELNPQFNALIGGRGTGKSTLLEYLRWALCDQAMSATDDSDLPDYQKRRQSLIEGTLAKLGESVTVTFFVNDIQHVVRRSSGAQDVKLKIGNGEFEECTEEDIRSILPVQAYSQKQLSSVGVRIQELRRFVHSPIRKELDDFKAQRKGICADLRTCHQEVARSMALKAEISGYEIEQRSCSEQLKKLREGLSDLTPEDQEVIAKRGIFESQERVLAGWDDEAQRIVDALGQITRELSDMPSAIVLGPDAPATDEMKTMEAEFRRRIDAAKGDLQRLGELFVLGDGTAKDDDFGSARAGWIKKRDGNDKKYTAASTRLKEQESTLTPGVRVVVA